jgi:HSP20 family protein
MRTTIELEGSKAVNGRLRWITGVIQRTKSACASRLGGHVRGTPVGATGAPVRPVPETRGRKRVSAARLARWNPLTRTTAVTRNDMTGVLTRWDPFGELTELRTRVDRIFDDLAKDRERIWTPAIDVVRDNGNLVVRADVPGIKPEEVKIEIEDDLLIVSGQHEETKEENEKHYVRRERRFGSFSRSIVLPAAVDAKQIKATTHDGVVEVTIPVPMAGQEGTHRDHPTAGMTP